MDGYSAPGKRFGWNAATGQHKYQLVTILIQDQQRRVICAYGGAGRFQNIGQEFVQFRIVSGLSKRLLEAVDAAHETAQLLDLDGKPS